MYSFTFRQIEVFLEICRAGNFSAAAERLQVSHYDVLGWRFTVGVSLKF